MGIDADSLPHVGTAFFRTPRTGETGIPGVGLGLMITKNIVEAHHGTLTISGREHEGTTVQIHLPNAPPAQATGGIAAGLGLAQDVTEARAAEHTLKESEERNRLTFEHAPIGQAIVELDGKWRQVNAALTKLTGYSEGQLLKMTFQDITHPDDLELDLAHLNQLLAGEIGSYQIEKRYFTASGQIVWALLSVALVHDEEGSPLYFIAQIQDITDRKRQQHALQDLTEMLAHDLRTPAAVMLGFAELLEGPAGSDAHEVHDYAARISAGARAMTDLLDNALTATALDSGQLIASPEGVSLRHSVVTTAQANDLGSILLDVSALDDVVAWVDPVHLSQVITNLLTNAAKYGADKVILSATSSHGRVVISIADNGPGVEPDFVPYLFDRFSRSAAARSGRQRGSGLGLYIVRDLLAANGGTIRYATSRSGGAEFRIDLHATRGAAPAYRRGHGTSRGADQLSQARDGLPAWTRPAGSARRPCASARPRPPGPQVAGQQRLELYDGIGMRLPVADREVQHRVGHVHDHLGDGLPVADPRAGVSGARIRVTCAARSRSCSAAIARVGGVACIASQTALREGSVRHRLARWSSSLSSSSTQLRLGISLANLSSSACTLTVSSRSSSQMMACLLPKNW